jgi:stage II sporulation protein D
MPFVKLSPMNLAFKTLTQSLRLWHVAPLCLPLFLGSTNAQNLSALAPTAVVAPPPTVTQLLAQQGIAVSHSSQSSRLPAQTLNAFAKAQPKQPLQYQSRRQQAQARSQQSQMQSQKAKSSSSQRPQAALAMAEAPKPARNLPFIPIRVAISTDAPVLAIATSDAGAIVDQEGKVLGALTAQTAVAATPSASGMQIGPWQTPSVVWIKPRSTKGLVYVGSHWYRGSVQVLLTSKGLLAVNYVDMESYLYSVVGSEMPAHWPGEALKAQAVAARSYAVVHMARPASSNYDLGATPRWQAYNGVESETNTTHLAVNETRGLLLSYQGGVVESLYASSDQLVKEAHGGFGMSQEGASQLAQQSLSYQQILGRFYPGTGLAVLNVK